MSAVKISNVENSRPHKFSNKLEQSDLPHLEWVPCSITEHLHKVQAFYIRNYKTSDSLVNHPCLDNRVQQILTIRYYPFTPWSLVPYPDRLSPLPATDNVDAPISSSLSSTIVGFSLMPDVEIAGGPAEVGMAFTIFGLRVLTILSVLSVGAPIARGTKRACRSFSLTLRLFLVRADLNNRQRLSRTLWSKFRL